MVSTVLGLLEKLEEEESILVEAMYPPVRLPLPGSHLSQPEIGSRDRSLDASGLRLLMFPQAVLHRALSWLCASVQWCVGFRVTGPY